MENQGPWGASAPDDSRLPDSVKAHLRTRKSIRVLMARRHHRAHREAYFRLFLGFPAQRTLFTTTFLDPEELLSIDLEAVSRGVAPPEWVRADGPLFGVCTHGRHDPCCAERGRPVAAALTAAYPAQTWEISHMGGDRFAANMLVLPEGLYYGRVEPVAAMELALLHQQGRLDLSRLRGRSSYSMPVQYAEIALRRHLGDDRLDAVRLVRREGATTVFRHEGVDWSVTLRQGRRGEAQLTCGLERLSPLPVFEVTDLRRL